MNNERRKRIYDIRNQIELLSATTTTLRAQMEAIQEAIESVRDDEQEAYDNLPESLQEGDKGSAMQAAIEQLDDGHQALSDIMEAFERFDEVSDNLDSAASGE